jgi:FkbM family methyltransferase
MQACEPDFKIGPEPLWGTEHSDFIVAVVNTFKPLRASANGGCLTRGDFLVIDIGVNTGAVTLKSAQHGARVIGFEAIPSNAEIVNQRVQLNGYSSRVKVLNVAAGEKSGAVLKAFDNYYERRYDTMDPSSGKQTSIVKWQRNGQIVFGADLANYSPEALIDVPVRAVDDEVGSEEKVLLLKIDVEGFEYPALIKGAQKMLSEHRVTMVHSEFCPGASGFKIFDPREYINQMLRWNYRVFIEDCSHNIADATVERLNTVLQLRCASSHGMVPALVQACKDQDFGSLANYEIVESKVQGLVNLLDPDRVKGVTELLNLIMC